MSNKEKLLELEKMGLYVFHGSPSGDIKILEPKQSEHIPNLQNPSETILDGKPAVSATPYVEFAIFRAIINGKNIPVSHTSGFGVSKGEKYFRVSSKEVLDDAQGKEGYVYVFNKNEFKPYFRDGQATDDDMEWRSYNEVIPLFVIKVTFQDLPDLDQIEIR